MRLLVEDGLRQREPLGVLGGRVGEARLGGDEGREGPKGLIVVAHGRGPVARHEVAVVADLEEHGRARHVVVRLVARVVAVVEQRPPHGAALPPVVVAVGGRSRQDARHPSRLVAAVECEEVFCYLRCCFFDGIWKIIKLDDLRRQSDECLEFRCNSNKVFQRT